MFFVMEEFPECEKLDPLWKDEALWCRVIAVWLAAGCDARLRLTEGRVSRARLRRITPLGDRALDVAETLVTLKLWERDGEDYVFHDWADVQESKEAVQHRRFKWRQHQAASRRRRYGGVANAGMSGADSTADSRTDSRADSRADSAAESAHPRVGTEEVKDLNSSSSADGEHDLGLRAMAEYQARLPNIATGFEYGSWREAWRWIGLQPAEQRSAVIATLVAHPAWVRQWRRLTPGHIRKWWQVYAGGELPVYSAAANDNGSANGKRKPSRYGSSEVSKPEEFKNQEET